MMTIPITPNQTLRKVIDGSLNATKTISLRKTTTLLMFVRATPKKKFLANCRDTNNKENHPFVHGWFSFLIKNKNTAEGGQN